MTKPPRTKVKLPMGQRKSGLAVPADKVDVCKHMEVLNRIKIPVPQYVCGDCGERLYLVIPQYGLMDRANYDRYNQARAQAAQAAQRHKSTGLVLPDEVRQEKQEGRK